MILLMSVLNWSIHLIKPHELSIIEFLCPRYSFILTPLSIGCQTRMHSSRMRTVCCSGHLSCHACPPATHAPPPCMPPCHACPLPCMPPLLCMPPAMHASHNTCLPQYMPPCHACSLPHMPPCYACPSPHMPLPWMPPPHYACTPAMHAPPDRILDICLWKHYLSATTVADGN